MTETFTAAGRVAALSLLFVASCTGAPGSLAGEEPDRGGVGKADLVGSCQPDDCGGPASTGTCWCDDECVAFGDCCGDAFDVCESPECTPAECGPEPAFVHCDGDSIAAPEVCVRSASGGCGWVATCEPTGGSSACAPADCGPNPGFVTCETPEQLLAVVDGCEPGADGICVWSSSLCPSAGEVVLWDAFVREGDCWGGTTASESVVLLGSGFVVEGTDGHGLFVGSRWELEGSSSSTFWNVLTPTEACVHIAGTWPVDREVRMLNPDGQVSNWVVIEDRT